MSDQTTRDNSLVPSGRALPAKTALVQRGIELADGLRVTEAHRDLYGAWIEFAMGCYSRGSDAQFANLRAAFVAGKAAWVSALGGESPRAPDVLVERELSQFVDLSSGPLQRWVASLTEDKRAALNDDLRMENLNAADLVAEVRAFLDHVARVIDPWR